MTLSTCHCLWFSFVIWHAYSCCWGSTFLSLLSLYFPVSYWLFLEVSFYFCHLFYYQQVGYCCGFPFAWEGWRLFSLVLEYPTASLFLICSPSFFTLHSSAVCVCSFFTRRISRIVLLFLLGTSARIADWNSLSILSFILQPLLDFVMLSIGIKNIAAVWGLQPILLFAQSSLATVSFSIWSLFEHFCKCSSFCVMFL